MAAFDPSFLKASGMAVLAVPVWEIGAAATLIAALCGLAIYRSRFGRASVTVATVGFVLMAIGGAVLFIGHSSVNENSAERRALTTRAANLAAQSLVPGSPLACLEGDLGDVIETACERIVFARPQAVAGGVVYTGARISLIADTLDYARRVDPAFAGTLIGVRRAIELDRYGIAAQVLATRDGCSADQCPFFALVRDPSTLKANLRARAFDTYVARYAPGWTAEEKPSVPHKPAEPAPAPQASVVEPPTPHAVVDSKYKFPSAASIPPVSIMNAEPPLPPGVRAAAGPNDGSEQNPAPPVEKLPIPPKRPQSQAAAPPAQ
ncbi:MAG: hypothetical protein ACR2K5_14885 [Pseudolabrys sp.]